MSRWIALGLTVFLSGGACYWLYSDGRVFDIAGILGMTALTTFFYAGDQYVDELHARDAKRAAFERRDWESNT